MDDYGDFLDDFDGSLGELESPGEDLESHSGDFNLAQPKKRESWLSDGSSESPNPSKK